MELKDGLYEQVINKIISDNIKRIDENKKLIQKEDIGEEESFHILSRYLSQVIEESLNSINKGNKLQKQIEISNKIIKSLIEETGEESLNDYLITNDAKMLLSVLDKINSQYAVLDKKEIARPITPLSQSSLFTGSNTEPSLMSELKKEILSSDSIDMLVSFIKWSGLRLIADELSEFTKDHRLRIITTSYMGATDYKAIEFLSRLPNTEVKISYDTKRTRLHAKAYMFYRNTGFSTAYIGSSNLSNAAISSGLEWNMKVTEQDSMDIIKKFNATFDAYWHDKEFIYYSIEDNQRLKRALYSEKALEKENLYFEFDIQPYSYQQEILERLDAERKIHNKYRNLVVAATGERVIIVIGCINTLISRVSGTFIKNNSCIA